MLFRSALCPALAASPCLVMLHAPRRLRNRRGNLQRKRAEPAHAAANCRHSPETGQVCACSARGRLSASLRQCRKSRPLPMSRNGEDAPCTLDTVFGPAWQGQVTGQVLPACRMRPRQAPSQSASAAARARPGRDARSGRCPAAGNGPARPGPVPQKSGSSP